MKSRTVLDAREASSASVDRPTGGAYVVARVVDEATGAGVGAAGADGAAVGALVEATGAVDEDEVEALAGVAAEGAGGLGGSTFAGAPAEDDEVRTKNFLMIPP